VLQVGGATHGWLVLLMVFAIALYIPFAIADINWLDNVSILWPITLLAVVVGVVLAVLRPHDVRGFVVGLIAGLLGIFVSVGQVVPSWGRLATDAGEVGRWIVTRGASVSSGQNPLARMWDVGAQSAAKFAGELVTWWRLGGIGEATVDNRIFLFLLAVISWTVVLYFAWALYSQTPALVALLPPGVVLVSFVVLGGQGAPYVYLFLLTALLMILRIHVISLERTWNRRNLDYPTTVGPELLATGLIFTLLVGGIALLLPVAPQNTLAVHFWGVFNDPWSQLEANVGEAFTGVRHRVGGNGGNDLYLGGPLSFGNAQTVLYAKTDEPPPPSATEHELEATGYVEPEHYLAGSAFQDYNGKGWELGKTRGLSRTGVPIGANGDPQYLGVGKGSENVLSHTPNQPIVGTPPQGDKIVQQIEKVSASNNLAYAYNEPVLIDQPYTLHETGGYPNQIDLKAGTTKYTVVSVVPSATAPDLRSAGSNYPAWVSPYMAKPNVPGRVAQLAEQWSAQAGNPYDKAMAIEGELRKIPYTTDISPPPPNRDAVDYFLFDLKRGYCEYYASAMVVMLREVGVPARIVTGYATTTYDRTRNAYVATDNDAHTWVQVYFPNAGWLDFEPTPINPELVRPEAASTDVAPVLPAVPQVAHPKQRIRLPIDGRILIGIVAALLIALVAFLIRRQWEAELSPPDLVRVLYGRMVRWSKRFGLAKQPEETALEFGHRLAQRYELTAEPVAQAVRQIVALYVVAQYAATPLGQIERTRAHDAWRTMRGHLWQLRRRR